MSQAGAVVLVETVKATGLDRAFNGALRPCRKPLDIHDRRQNRAGSGSVLWLSAVIALPTLTGSVTNLARSGL